MITAASVGYVRSCSAFAGDMHDTLTDARALHAGRVMRRSRASGQRCLHAWTHALRVSSTCASAAGHKTGRRFGGCASCWQRRETKCSWMPLCKSGWRSGAWLHLCIRYAAPLRLHCSAVRWHVLARAVFLVCLRCLKRRQNVRNVTLLLLS